jgi:hypothetical protein
LLTLTMYKYSELQVSFATQKLSRKANCKRPFFHSGTNINLLRVFLIIFYTFKIVFKFFNHTNLLTSTV